MRKLQWEMTSSIGPLYLVASSEGLHGVYWNKQSVPYAEALNCDEAAIAILRMTVAQIWEYLNGQRRTFAIPLTAAGTVFQKRVWEQLKQIPYGQTRSYGDIARRLNNSKAVRAVGSANGKNPISIIVPCHRVIGKDGTLTGFAGGLEIKAKLLELERLGQGRR